LVIQILNLSLSEVFEFYSKQYNIPRELYYHGLFGLEIRSLSDEQINEIHSIVLNCNKISYRNYNYENDNNLLLPGSINDFIEIANDIRLFGNEDVSYRMNIAINNFEDYEKKEYLISNRKFSFNNVYVMGILNITPDSFSDGGKYFEKKRALNHALNMIEEGADIIDIGGESTRPGSDPVSAEEEIKRIVPVIENIISEYPRVIISADTNKSVVAEEALKAGATIINDISGATFDENIFSVVKKYNAGIILMHIKGIPKNMQSNPEYINIVKEVYDFLYARATAAHESGIENIIIDPGIGFGKTMEHNLELIKRLADFKSMGYPLLVGTSRKSFLGKITGLNINERDTASVISETFLINSGARFIRTHNVKNGIQLKKIYKAIQN